LPPSPTLLPLSLSFFLLGVTTRHAALHPSQIPVFTKYSNTSAKELYTFAKEPYTFAKVPHITAKKPCIQPVK